MSSTTVAMFGAAKSSVTQKSRPLLRLSVGSNPTVKIVFYTLLCLFG